MKIADAIFRAARAIGGRTANWRRIGAGGHPLPGETKGPGIPTVEEVQDAVEKVLIETGHAGPQTYILYHDWRTRLRETKSS